VSVTTEFRALAERVVDDLLASDPVGATWLGDHRFDGRLPDLSEAGVAARLERLDQHITAIDAVDDVELDVADLVDLEILRARLMRTRFELDELRRHAWDPMAWNPGTAVHLLLSRPFAPAEERAAALRARLSAVPDALATARAQLGPMPAVHVQTAISQLAGTRHLIDGEARALAGDDVVVDRALAQVAEFEGWLAERLPDAHRSPRLGARLYAGALWHALDDHTSPDDLLRDAQAHLAAVTERLAEAAREYLGADAPADDAVAIRTALDDVADRATVTDATVLPLMEAALARTTQFVRERDLVGIPELEMRVIEMPEIHRGVAVAYCDAPGPLEASLLPTFVAVAPTPAGWEAERIASFYREYNAVQLHGLAVHEAMPGHVLQLAHGRRLDSPTRVRRLGTSGVFVEGWAVYAEQLMADQGYDPGILGERGPAALRLQQLKMQARGAINAILDIGVHAHDLDEQDGLSLMRDRGHQEEGEAVGKWRRALLTSAQLPTYFAGYRAVSGIVDDLTVLHADWDRRRLHDLVLAHGSPAPRHLRTLLGI
jgi:uncharacterized protein (DUF885 family)